MPGMVATHHCVEQILAPGRDHRAPLGQRRLRAKAKETEACGGQDDAGHVEGQAHDQGRGAQRHDVAPDDARARGALQADRSDEIGVAHGQRLGARDPGIGRPGGDRDRDDRVLDAGAERRDEGERQDQARKREEDVGDAHQDGVDPAAEIAGDGADQKPDRADQDHHEADDVERDARAVDDARVDVAAELVGAEPVRRRRRLQAVGEILGGRRMGRDPWRQRRDQHQRQHDAEPGDRQRVAAEGEPGEVAAAEPRLQAGCRLVGEQPGPPDRRARGQGEAHAGTVRPCRRRGVVMPGPRGAAGRRRSRARRPGCWSTCAGSGRSARDRPGWRA